MCKCLSDNNVIMFTYHEMFLTLLLLFLFKMTFRTPGRLMGIQTNNHMKNRTLGMTSQKKKTASQTSTQQESSVHNKGRFDDTFSPQDLEGELHLSRSAGYSSVLLS